MNRINNSLVSTAVFTLLFFMYILSFNANADMGRVSVAVAKVSEESQKAIILHNSEEEVLILGTDLKASEKTGIIRFIPFPSEPKVSLAPSESFEAIIGLVKKHKLKFLTASKGGSVSAVPVEIRLNQKLGAHDITVIKINDIAAFRKWVNDFFKGKSLPQKEKYPEVENIAEDYVKKGIVYFVFDFVEIGNETKFIEPVMYKFKSKELYYPLKTSNTFGGKGEIDLFLILPGTLYDSVAANPELYSLSSGHWQASTSANTLNEELVKIYPQAGEFFKGKKAFLQLVSYWGEYKFEKDIFADISKARPYEQREVIEETGSPWMFPMDELVKEINQKKCSLKPERGPCKGMFEKYYFDAVSKTCKKFIWGGCEGVAPFDTKEECEKGCGNAGKK